MRIGISKHVGSISNVVVDIHYSLVLFVFFVTVPAITEADVVCQNQLRGGGSPYGQASAGCGEDRILVCRITLRRRKGRRYTSSARTGD